MIKRAIHLLALLIVCATPARADWRDSLTTTRGSFPALRPFHAHYRFGWTMFPAAEADFTMTRMKGGITRLAATSKSIGVVRTSWKMDSDSVSTMRTATLRPIALTQTEIYRTESEKTHVDYTDTGVTRLRISKPVNSKPRPKKFDFPLVHDLQSAVHFIRSQRLADGDAYEVVVYPSVDPYLARIEVEGRTEMKIAGARQKVIKLDLKLSKINKDLELENHEKFKRATIFLGDDADRMLLRIEGELTVGSVWCELEKVEWAK